MRHFHHTLGREAISRHPHTVGRGTGPRHAVTLNIFCLFLLTFAAPTWAWWGGGHKTLTRASVKALPEELPEFFRAVFAENAIAHGAHDPDLARNRSAPNAREAEYAQHYIDVELLQGRPFAENLRAHIELCAELGTSYHKVGTLPYALAEWTERLAIAFAEHRKWPDNPIIQSKCLVYAGFVAHYAQDMCQPLHLTVHFNGRAKSDGSSPGTGIHENVDALIERLELKADDLAKDQEITPVEELLPAIFQQVEAWHRLVDSVYDLEEELKNYREPTPALVDFANERAREAVRWTSALYLTAWRMSDGIPLPGWLNR